MPHRNGRLGLVMPMVVVFAALLCAPAAFAQTRPILSEVFQSPITIQVATAEGELSDGVGDLAFDQPAGQARERYLFHGGPPVEIITRYDLGKIFSIDPPSCDVTDVTGPMPLTWDWIAQAKQGAAVVVDGVTYTKWVSSGTGPLKTVATNKEGTFPIFLEIRTPEKAVRITFLNWQTTFDQKKNALKPPNHCPKK